MISWNISYDLSPIFMPLYGFQAVLLGWADLAARHITIYLSASIN